MEKSTTKSIRQKSTNLKGQPGKPIKNSVHNNSADNAKCCFNFARVNQIINPTWPNPLMVSRLPLREDDIYCFNFKISQSENEAKD